MELTISKFAELVDTTVRALRHYEQIELLIPLHRNSKNQKVYTTIELKKYHTIQLLKNLDLSLSEIKSILESENYSFNNMIDVQEKILLQKLSSIQESLQILSRIKTLLKTIDEPDSDHLLLLMKSMRLDIDQSKVLKEHLSNEAYRMLYPTDQEKLAEYDELQMKFFNLFHHAKKHNLAPNSHEVQIRLKQLNLESLLTQLYMEELTKQEVLDSISKYSELLPEDFQAFMSDAIIALLENLDQK